MDKGTVLQYENLSAEDLIYWQRRAFREWAFRPGPAFVYLKMLFSDLRTFKRAVRVGMEHLGWALGRGHGASQDSRVHGLKGSEVQRFGVASKTLNP